MQRNGKNWQDIVYEDKDLIVVYKTAGMATQTARLGEPDMVSELKNYLAASGGKGEPYVGVVHRLDQPVEGLLVFAKNKMTAAELSRQAANGTMTKHYYAVVAGVPELQEGELKDNLIRDGQTNRSCVLADRVVTMATEGDRENSQTNRSCVMMGAVANIDDQKERLCVTGKTREDEHNRIRLGSKQTENAGKEACLSYQVLGAQEGTSLSSPQTGMAGHTTVLDLDAQEGISLLEVRLATGRHHQIRVQLAHAGMPILGEAKYGTVASQEISERRNCRQLALCAGRLTFIHPRTKVRKSFAVKPGNPIFQVFSSFFSNL